MSEVVSFWLDNKMSSGTKVAQIGSQTLVSYREKFYVIEDGDAQSTGSRPVHYSKSSMPSVWKKAMRGITPLADTNALSGDAPLPLGTQTKKVRRKAEKPLAEDINLSPLPDFKPSQTELNTQEEELAPAAAKVMNPKPAKKADLKPAALKPALQASVTANCPYCDQKHVLPVEKGKNGKPFFTLCSKCSNEFAVRFVQVSIYQAQVAGFL